MECRKTFLVKGKVQGIMFRQTVIRGAEKRGLCAGATNDPTDRSIVRFTLQGDESLIQEIVDFMTAGKKLNSWGACVESLEELSPSIDINAHEVTTLNVDGFKWTSGVEFFL
ncbi:MAG: hypothetical protein EP326_05050 [Deltaproteobacteria bacterium]|jgi:acylphosphatase|nr:MAG: hypothetical protein EP326_05050 [Deltaproteobacteria bacterium]TNF24412.1 MAG: hypothetical protein EP319_18550 [Deltaproteobacteria bacterium]